MERDDTEKRKVNPYHLVFRDGQFYLIGYSYEREAVRVFRLSRIQGKVGYASKAEHDFAPPEDFDRRDYASRADWQLGEMQGTAKIFLRERIAWLVERDFGDFGEFRPARKADKAPGKGLIFETEYASERELISWVLRWRSNAEVLEPKELRRRSTGRIELLRDRHAGLRGRRGRRPPPARKRAPHALKRPRRGDDPPRALRPPGHPRRDADRVRQEGEPLSVHDLCKRLKLTVEELREDIDVLNVVNFGGGTYVLYAEISGDEVEVDSEPYGDCFARPARLLPLEAKALVAAIDLFGDHLPQAGLQTARSKIVDGARPRSLRGGAGDRPDRRRSQVARIVNDAIAGRRVLELRYYKENEDQFTEREVEPYRLENGREGWYVECFDLAREAVRHFKLDRIKEARLSGKGFEPRPEVEEMAGVEGWMGDGEVPTAERRPGLGLAGAGSLAARGAHRGRGTRRRRGRDRRASLCRHRLARAGDPARRRRPRRARARRRPRGDQQRGRRIVPRA